METVNVTLAGNPNVGKSTLFNKLTGLHQHTGNWPGKTVGIARGERTGTDVHFVFTDLPGTYSISGDSEDERIAAGYLQENSQDCTVIVCDAGCLERSLILALQILPMCPHSVLCINLADAARKRGIGVDAKKLSARLGIPVVLTSAGKGEGIPELLSAIRVAQRENAPQFLSEDVIEDAQSLARCCTKRIGTDDEPFRRRVDRLFVSRRFGVPFLLLILMGIIWLTVWGANYPGAALEWLFGLGYDFLYGITGILPLWLRGILVDGVYATAARVMAVMLPPMAIFFPLFTLLEDIGYLPRMAFLLDPAMARCGGCGKQALTLCMGLGCNAVGVMGCRIIGSPRERVRAILTNAFVPCNGRFPTLILLGSLFFSDAGAALAVAACVALGVVGAMVISGILSKTVLRAQENTFIMEIPPFRRPRLGQILVRSLLDRTLFVAGRALCVAAPAGAILWIGVNTPVLEVLVRFFDPVGLLLGLNGVILLAFIFALPANELLLPVVLMIVTGQSSVAAVGSTAALQSFMTWEMAVCTMVFTLFHWPCATTLMTVYKETGSKKLTAAALILPTAVGCILCFLLNLIL